ncbi:hypothetical protein HU200_065448 [Digitaria exilis]|uniref:Alpha/beta hydrolase fold-3 domain-containing protein n=1 Tax=Digitaria exilis TaxID=1010633 RepID=A0A835DXW8_9POAL|nr:hypothetical protein HU200_065448 [Digitaria exilis]
MVSAATSSTRLPVVVYIHGGSFCTESAFCRTYHRCHRTASRRSTPIPTAYNDAWSALRWATSSTSSLAHDPWLAAHADPTRTFVAGGNIAYHTATSPSS